MMISHAKEPNPPLAAADAVPVGTSAGDRSVPSAAALADCVRDMAAPNS